MTSEPLYYRVSELPNSLLEQITELIAKFSTALIRITEGPRGRAGAQLIGSGTFVRINNISGIITAQHVTELIEPSSKIGLILVEEEHRFPIESQYLTIVNLADAIVPSEGPDLSFISLPSPIVSQITPFRSFYNLSADRDTMLTKPPPHEAGVWFVCGTPDERTRIEASMAGFGQVLSFSGHCGAGGPSLEYEKDGYDYIELDVEYKETEDLPTSFGGISGGGLWQVMLSGASIEQLKPTKYIYCGVPFYQSELKDRKRTIKCHSRKSIYSSLFARVEERCA